MNKKGFLLAESIIVAVFVVGMFTYLALNIFPLMVKYDNALDYDNSTEVYLANNLYNEMINEGINIPDTSICEISTLSGDCGYINNSEYIRKLVSNMEIEIVLVYKGQLNDASLNAIGDRGIRTYYHYQNTRIKTDTIKKNGKFMLIKFSYDSSKSNKYASVYLG